MPELRLGPGRPIVRGSPCDRLASIERFEKNLFLDYLRCPDCGDAMRTDCLEVTRSVCGYRKSLHSPVDLRPSRSVQYSSYLIADPLNMSSNYQVVFDVG